MKNVRTMIVRHNNRHAVVVHMEIRDRNNYQLYRLSELDGPVPEYFKLTRLIYTDPKSLRSDVLELLKSIKNEDKLCLVKEYVPKSRISELRALALKLRNQNAFNTRVKEFTKKYKETH